MASQAIDVASKADFDAWIVHLQGKGFGLRWYQPPTAVVIRPKRLSAGWLLFWLLVGWLLVWIPLILFLILFATAHDEVITIRLAEPDSSGAVAEIWQGSPF